jgi:hypothetical protein
MPILCGTKTAVRPVTLRFIAKLEFLVSFY